MNYEEKYKEMKKRVLAIGQGYVKEVDYSSPRSIAEYIDPELRESEDEKISNAIIAWLKATQYVPNNQAEILNSWIAWLEKQAEQKPTDKIKLKFKVGDIVRHKNGDTVIITQINEKNHCYYYKTYDGAATVHSDFSFGEECDWELDTTWTERQGVLKPTQEVKPFEPEHGKYYYCIKDYFYGGKKFSSKGDVVQALRGLPIMGLKDASEYFLPVNFIKCNSAWSEEDENMLEAILHTLGKIVRYKDFDGVVMSSCENAANWLKSIKERVQSQPKQEWSKEDEQMLESCIDKMSMTAPNLWKKEIDWLKSLKPNYWKPSEQNIKDLEWCADLVKDKMGVGFHRLQVFIDELKKL